ncbi:MAG: spore maturation protein [Chitinophagaceae bacterium]|nr:spore maturation protein [Chitinophagaceae bacterium]
MILSYIWVAFFIVAFVIAFFKWTLDGDQEIFKVLVEGIFKSANDGFDISLKLVGIMALFLGFMRIGEKAGAINFLSRIVGPFFSRLFPEVPKNHPATGQMMMNFSANLLGLDNAATPFGLKAMESLQELNPDKSRASNAQIMFLCLHASGLTLIPVSIIAIRASMNPPAANPTDIFIPCMIVTFVATMAAMITVAIRQRINLLQPVIIGWILGVSLLIGALIWRLQSLSQEELQHFSVILSNGLILLIFFSFLVGALVKKVNVFDAFIEGAKGGFEIAVKIIPYLIAMLVAISVLRNSGVFDYIIQGFSALFSAMGMNTDFVASLPTALMKPLSGSGARGMMIDAMNTYGADSFQGRLSSIFQGTSDTTFYVVAVYFGAVSIKNTRYAVPVMLLADLVGVITAIGIAYLFFH